MRPLIKWTLRQRRNSTIWWSVGLVGFISLEMSVYPTIKSQASQLNDALNRLPGTVRSLFGSQDLFSPVGYLNSRIFYLLFPLMLSILAIGLGSSLIAREESDGTIELLLSRPLARGRLVLGKATAGLLVLIIIASISAVALLLWVKSTSLAVPIPRVAFAALQAGVLAAMFGALAFALAAMGRFGRGASIGIASLIGLGSYIVASLEGSVHWLETPAKLLPYHYYNPTAVLNGSYTWMVTAVFALITLGLGLVAYLAFRRRDLMGS